MFDRIIITNYITNNIKITCGRSVLASSPRKVMVSTVVTPVINIDIFNYLYIFGIAELVFFDISGHFYTYSVIFFLIVLFFKKFNFAWDTYKEKYIGNEFLLQWIFSNFIFLYLYTTCQKEDLSHL